MNLFTAEQLRLKAQGFREGNRRCGGQSSITATRFRPLGTTRTGLIISSLSSPRVEAALSFETLSLCGMGIRHVLLIMKC